MTIDVEVDEDWTNTVTRMPMMNPVIGLLRNDSSENISPAVLPAVSEFVFVHSYMY